MFVHIMNDMQTTLSVIDLGAIRHNARYLKKLCGGSRLYAVVKADAYGHGAERVALSLEGLVYGFCVAIMQEGAALRVAGVTSPVLVLTPVCCAEEAEEARFYGLQVSVGGAYAAKYCRGLDCHIKLNTGMNRYGCPPGSALKLARLLTECGADVCGMYSHLYCPHIRRERDAQLDVFNREEKALKAAYPHIVCHLSASAGTMLGGSFLKDGVRCGIALYGYAPHGFERGGLKRALTVYAPKVQTSPVCGKGVGYAVAKTGYDILSAYRAGYADGFSRTAALGEANLCMDAFVSADTRPFVPVFTDADEYAACCGTISYEVLCSVTRRSERVYVNG